MKKSYTLIACITLILFFVIGCPQSKPEIIVGDEVEVTSEIIDEDGGTIVVDKPGDPLDGFTLEVPEGSYIESKTFKISYRPVEGHNLTGGFSPITPLIKVDNGGDRAQKAMTVTIPIDLPEGHFATAFFYDETTNRLEGMTFVDLDDSTLTVATSHFSEFTILSILEDDFPHDVDSKFKVGEDGDNWQFTNYGSYITPKGNCLGQSIMAVYYYIEKKMGEGKSSLYGLYDNDGNIYHPTPKIWQDDVLAYRLCSTAQKTAGTELSLYDNVWTAKDKTPLYNLYCFYAGIYLDGAPQYVEILRETAKSTPEKPVYSGHAMIVYKITRSTNGNGEEEAVLHISDPNYPNPKKGEERKIVYNFKNKKFDSYFSGPDADHLGLEYPIIYFRDMRSLIDPVDFDLLWYDFQGETIGDDYFPDYTIYICKKDSVANITDCKELSDGYQVPFYVYSYCFKAEVDGEEAALEIYDEDQNHICDENHSVDLKEGSNFLGFYVKADVTYENADGEEKTTEEWVGFDWLDVVYDEDSTTTTTTNMTFPAYYAGTVKFTAEYTASWGATLNCELEGTGQLTLTDYLTVEEGIYGAAFHYDVETSAKFDKEDDTKNTCEVWDTIFPHGTHGGTHDMEKRELNNFTYIFRGHSQFDPPCALDTLNGTYNDKTAELKGTVECDIPPDYYAIIEVSFTGSRTDDPPLN